MIKPEFKETKLEAMTVEEYIKNRQREIDVYVNTKKETLENIEKLRQITKDLLQTANGEDCFEQFIEELTAIYKKYNLVNSPTLMGTVEQYLYYVTIY